MKVRLLTLEEIRSKAYQIYLARGCEHGHDIDDWLQAEYELMQLPLHKIATLDAIAIEKEKVQKLRLFNLALAFLKPKKQSRKQLPPFWDPTATSSTPRMSASA